jgi:hypothetical protein
VGHFLDHHPLNQVPQPEKTYGAGKTTTIRFLATLFPGCGAGMLGRFAVPLIAGRRSGSGVAVGLVGVSPAGAKSRSSHPHKADDSSQAFGPAGRGGGSRERSQAGLNSWSSGSTNAVLINGF